MDGILCRKGSLHRCGSREGPGGRLDLDYTPESYSRSSNYMDINDVSGFVLLCWQ